MVAPFYLFPHLHFINCTHYHHHHYHHFVLSHTLFYHHLIYTWLQHTFQHYRLFSYDFSRIYSSNNFYSVLICRFFLKFGNLFNQYRTLPAWIFLLFLLFQHFYRINTTIVFHLLYLQNSFLCFITIAGFGIVLFPKLCNFSQVLVTHH